MFCVFVGFLFFLFCWRLSRELAVAVVRTLIRAGLQQKRGALRVVVLSRVVERRAALLVAAIGVRAHGQQRGNHSLIALAGRSVQRRPEARRRVALAAVEGHSGRGVDGRAGVQQHLDDCHVAVIHREGQRCLLIPDTTTVHIAHRVQ